MLTFSTVIALAVGAIFHIVGLVTEELALWQRAPTKDYVPDEDVANAVSAAQACSEVTGTPRKCCQGRFPLLIFGRQESTQFGDQCAIVDQRSPISPNSNEDPTSPAMSSQTVQSISRLGTSLRALLLESSVITENGS